MDDGRFDQLARAVSSPGSRRGLLRLLATLPFAGALALLLGARDADANGACVGCGHRRKRRNRNGHHHKNHEDQRKRKRRQQKQRRQKRKKGCTPEPPAQTCEGQCGTVENNCQQSVECDPCACDPACSACEICDLETTECVADPDAVGESCGTGQICDNENQCVPCGGDGQLCCPDGQCDSALVCDPRNDRCSPSEIELVLSGGADPTTPIVIDDDLRVLLNGQIIFDDTDGVAEDIPPIAFRARPDDILHVVGTNVVAPCIRLSPLYLQRTDSGQTQVLDATGEPQSCDNHAPGIFYDQTFAVAL